MEQLSAQVHKLIDELDEMADNRTAFRSESNRIGCVGADFFIGIKVAEIRKVAERYANICLEEIEQLLLSEVHEHRMCALIILKKQFKQGNERERTEIFEFYINHTNCINDWDLIDSSSPYIVGEYLHDKPCDVLYRLAKSDSPWDNRIAMMATYTFIHNGNVEDTYRLALSLMGSPHVMVQKAVGWMLHEAGKYDLIRLSLFIGKKSRRMKLYRQPGTASIKSRNGSGRERNRKEGKNKQLGNGRTNQLATNNFLLCYMFTLSDASAKTAK